MLQVVTELSEIVQDFMSRFHLKKAAAARVLGVSTNYVSSLVSGVDINTGLPFKPRESTLMQLSAKMTDFGYPMTPAKLMRAAGLDVPAQVALATEITQAINSIPGLTTAAQVGAPTKAGKLPPLASFIYTRRADRPVEELAREVGVDPVMFQHIDAGYVPPTETLGKIAAALGASLDELRQAMQAKSGSRPAIAADPMQAYAALAGSQVEMAFYGKVGCGEFLDLSEQPIEFRDVPVAELEGEPVEDLAVLEAWGNSMNLAGILPGMALLVRKQAHAEHDQVVIATVPFQGTTCKRFVKRPDGNYLVAESTEAYPDIKIGEGVRIDGVVRAAWALRRFS